MNRPVGEITEAPSANGGAPSTEVGSGGGANRRSQCLAAVKVDQAHLLPRAQGSDCRVGIVGDTGVPALALQPTKKSWGTRVESPHAELAWHHGHAVAAVLSDRDIHWEMVRADIRADRSQVGAQVGGQLLTFWPPDRTTAAWLPLTASLMVHPTWSPWPGRPWAIEESFQRELRCIC
jgi:hypothetical protein